MSILSSVLNITDTIEVNPYNFKGDGGLYFFGMGHDGLDLYSGQGNEWYFNAYKYCAPIATMINRKAEAFINGINYIIIRSGKGKGKDSYSEAAGKIRSLMNQPNPLQSWSQFEAQYLIYFHIFGYCPILPIKPVGFKENIDTVRLWIIPPYLVSIEETKNIWYQDDGKTIINNIFISLGGQKTKLKWDEIFMLKDITPSLNSLIIPDSRLSTLQDEVATVMQGFRATKNGMKNTPLGIIGNDTKDSISHIPINPEEKQKIQAELMHYGLNNNQRKIIISDAALRWTPINYPIDTLKIPENIKLAVSQISDALGYPFELLSNENGVTFNNKREAGKMLYQDFIIPLSKNIYEQWNQFFNTEVYNLLIEKDYSQVPILQQDALQKAQARKMGNEAYIIEFENDLITVNRWLELNGEDTRTDGNIYFSEWIKTHPELLLARSKRNNNNNSTSNSNE